MKYMLDHVGVAVRRIDDALPFYLDVLNGVLEDRYTSEATGVEVHVAVVKTEDKIIELLEPTNKNSPIARFLKQRGKGVHHLAYRVDDLDKAILEAKNKGVRFLEDTLRVNARGRRLIYINPISTDGTLIELCEYPTS
ncbi:methylmalonyl-CoA epimerase [Anaerobacillus isosaccharinicus]|uniref:Methylmalonyl-CoA epimerase n=1 Tax=Anaerobacillus isosaccharinicus TaxID=1532552 RepID=A0A1S2MET3_9BACI|nr:methylmalonyl-CoA epimerase [Anaerobacillus isosaccharinicus]MBA5586707.1 methylmalonyl-CoA epimerase [Anaerobacillus isosaccharinicus]QOY35068.1 methylmalonyl-CoA epimerase [Anaerobacillus isosaccharinicus]